MQAPVNVQFSAEQLFHLQLAKLEAEKEMQIREREIQKEIRLKEIECENRKPSPQIQNPNMPRFDLLQSSKLVPVFNEQDVERFFRTFERVANKLLWPAEFWCLLIQSKFNGKAQRAYASLSEDQSEDYEVVKREVLKAYELVPEAYRLEFKGTRKTNEQTYVEFGRSKTELLDKWKRAKNVKTLNEFEQMILIEEFLRSPSRGGYTCT